MTRQRTRLGICPACKDRVVLTEDGRTVGHDDNGASQLMERPVFCVGSNRPSDEADR